MKQNQEVITAIQAPSRSEGPYVWVTGFDEHHLESFMSKFFELESSPLINIIPIYISSYGGEVTSLNAMRDIIKGSSKPVATIAMGKAMSAGASLLASGTKGLRFIAPSTSVMVHELSSGTIGKETDIQASAAWLKALNKRILTNLAKDMGISYNDLKNKLARLNNSDWHMTAEEAVKVGLADNIGIPRMAISQQVDLVSVNVPGGSRGKKTSS